MAAMSASLGFLFAAGNFFSWGASLVVSLIFIVVIGTIVRSHRPDVAPLLLWAAICELLVNVGSLGVSMLLLRFLTPTFGMKIYAETQALNATLTALLHAGARGLLLWGIVRLARPAASV
jgi:hypothetical protein